MLTPGVTPVRSVHLTELRAALDAVYDAAGRPRPNYTDAVVTAGVSVVKAAHVTELREAVEVVASSSPSLDSFYAHLRINVVDPTYPPEGTFAASADLDGDGSEDLIILGADYPGDGASTYRPRPGRVYLGDGNGGFTRAPSERFPTDTLNTVHPRNVRFGDLNGDGRLDMFVAAHGWDVDPFPGEQNRLYLSRPGGGWRDASSGLPQLSDFSHSAAIGEIRLSSNGCGWVEARSAGRRGVLAVHLTGGGRGAPWPGVGRSGVAAGRPACQRATRVLRCAAALRVTHRPSLRSSSRYGPCGSAWTGASRPSTTTRKSAKAGGSGINAG